MRRELPVLDVGFSQFGVLSRARSDESDVRWERGTQPPGVAFASLAGPIITLAIAIVARSLRSINPSWLKAASNAADMLAMSSGPNEWSSSRGA
jgi:hypothetical protein